LRSGSDAFPQHAVSAVDPFLEPQGLAGRGSSSVPGPIFSSRLPKQGEDDGTVSRIGLHWLLVLSLTACCATTMVRRPVGSRYTLRI
jgi:hypothetical protein